MEPSSVNLVSNSNAEGFRGLSLIQVARFALPAVLPLLVFLAMRIIIHRVVGLRLGYASLGTDWDFVPHCILAYLLYLMCGKFRPENLRFRKKTFLALLLSLGCFLAFSFYFAQSLNYSSTGLIVAWFLMASFCIALSLSLYLPFGVVVSNGVSWVPFILLATSGLLSNQMNRYLGSFLIGLSSTGSAFLIQSVVPEVALSFFPQTDPGGSVLNLGVVGTQIFTIVIGSGCSGSDGITLFLSSMLLFQIVERPSFRWFHWALLLLSGVLFMCALNCFRIALFFSVCHTLAVWWGSSPAIEALQTLFHKGAGFAVYVCGLALFFFWALLLERALSSNSPMETLKECEVV
jgi:exosortase/archaeosortase family protein